MTSVSQGPDWLLLLGCVSSSAGVDAIDYFERRFPDLNKMPTSGANANCAEWLLSVTTQV